jgi:hypothetical protein
MVFDDRNSFADFNLDSAVYGIAALIFFFIFVNILSGGFIILIYIYYYI